MELYSFEQERRLRLCAKVWSAAAGAVAFLALAGCIVCCVLSTTATADEMTRDATILSVCGGWFVIFSVTVQIFPKRHAAEHVKNMLEGVREEENGIITVEPEVLQIPKSIEICRVVLDTGTEKKRLSIRADRAKLLKGQNGQYLTLCTVYGYIVAFEGA